MGIPISVISVNVLSHCEDRKSHRRQTPQTYLTRTLLGCVGGLVISPLYPITTPLMGLYLYHIKD